MLCFEIIRTFSLRNVFVSVIPGSAGEVDWWLILSETDIANKQGVGNTKLDCKRSTLRTSILNVKIMIL